MLRKHLPVLRYISQAELGARMRRRMGDVAAAEEDAAALGRHYSRQCLQSGALASAVTPQQCQRALFLKCEIKIEQDLACAVKGAHSLGAQEVRHASCASVPR